MGQSKKFLPPGDNLGGTLRDRPNNGPRGGFLEIGNVGAGGAYQRKVIVGGVSNEGCKISAREINRRGVVEAIPLKRETRERLN